MNTTSTKRKNNTKVNKKTLDMGERNKQIIAKRKKGQGLWAIGREFGIGGPRVAQIFFDAIRKSSDKTNRVRRTGVGRKPATA